MALALPSFDARARASLATATLSRMRTTIASATIVRTASQRFARTKQLLFQNLGRSEKTEDDAFDVYVANFNRQNQQTLRLHKQLEAYEQSLRTVDQARVNLFDAFKESYDEAFAGRIEVNNNMESIMTASKEFIKELNRSKNHLQAHKAQFPSVKAKIEKRHRKLVDFDAWRHTVVETQATKKVDFEKVLKAEENANEAKRVFESLNAELYDRLPELHDERIPTYAKTLQALFRAETTFHERSAKFHEALIDCTQKLLDEDEKGAYATKRHLVPALTLPARPAAPPRKTKAQTSTKDEGGEANEDGTSTPPVRDIDASDNEQMQPATLPDSVKATHRVTHRYDGNDDDELTLECDDVIHEVKGQEEELEEGWGYGYVVGCEGVKGLFPFNFTEEL